MRPVYEHRVRVGPVIIELREDYKSVDVSTIDIINT